MDDSERRVCVFEFGMFAIFCIMVVGGYALYLGYNHTLPSLIIAAIAGIFGGVIGYKKGRKGKLLGEIEEKVREVGTESEDQDGPGQDQGDSVTRHYNATVQYTPHDRGH